MFRAHEPGDRTRERLVAVKVFRLDFTPEQAAALVAELDSLVAAAINHPNIAAPIAAGLDGTAAYLAQEYAVGDSLDVVLRERGAMSIGEVVELVTALAAAIDFAAARGVHHGSLHMRDILLAPGTARITGFGVAAALAKVGAKLPTRPPFASPDGPSDIYSLAALAFQALAGKRWLPEQMPEVELRHGEGVRAAFASVLEVEPAARPARATEFAQALMGAVGASGAISAADPPTVPEIEIDVPAARELEFDVPAGFGVALAEPLTDTDAAVPGRRWPTAVMFVVFAALVAVAVNFFLRRPEPNSAAGARSVDETTVDVRAPDATASASADSADRPGAPDAPEERNARVARSAPNAPNAPNAPTALSTPPPAPSRTASGAARGTQTGRLLIRSSPADADVLVNGAPRGKTPLALRELALGSYTIRITHLGYTPEERTLQITSRRPTASATVNLRRAVSAADAGTVAQGPGELTVQSRPAGARVFVNERLTGSTPLAMSDLPAGSATVRIEMDGYRPWVTTVRIGAGEHTKVAASLETK